jgi:hypothetical protein
MEITMANQNNNKVNTSAAVNTTEDSNAENPTVGKATKGPERQPKTFKDRVLGMEKHAKGTVAGAGRLAKSGAKAIGRGTTSLTREVVADAAGGAAGIVTTMIVGGVVNRCLVDAANMVDYHIDQKHPHTFTVTKKFGRKATLSEGEYYKALAKGKKYKKVVGNDWIVNHRKTIDNGLATASYTMGAGAGVAAGLTTRAAIKNQMVLNSRINKAVRTALDGSDYEEDGQI